MSLSVAVTIAATVFSFARTTRDVADRPTPTNITGALVVHDLAMVGALRVAVDARPTRLAHAVVTAYWADQSVNTLLLTAVPKPACLTSGAQKYIRIILI
ncbi:hypothetical protein DPMN_117964 [Dreissena polymorpha]|uniref:Uncharacterized protein n=1 Tax=Dreissena polymorpha TaxID=45954 RepID=A0A9D4GJB1_DREPO|nr:hypothetical protein DPMN_117964 [Dreissena polymorpha]